MSNLDQIAAELNSFGADVKAEAIVYTLAQQSLPIADLLVQCTQGFRRSYSKDVHQAVVKQGKTNDYLQLSLARTGMYDLLPEGLFFQPSMQGSRPQSAAEMAAEYKNNKKEEGNIRRFFAPLEHEFFLQQYKVFKWEVDTAESVYAAILNAYLKKLWQLPKNMPLDMVSRMVRILPGVHCIAGNAKLMAEALSVILDEVVTCALQAKQTTVSIDGLGGLGTLDLGISLICGSEFTEEQFTCAFSIHASKNKPSVFLPNGQLFETLQCFYHYVVPANASVETIILVSVEKAAFVLDNQDQGRIGISSTI